MTRTSNRNVLHHRTLNLDDVFYPFLTDKTDLTLNFVFYFRVDMGPSFVVLNLFFNPDINNRGCAPNPAELYFCILFVYSVCIT